MNLYFESQGDDHMWKSPHTTDNSTNELKEIMDLNIIDSTSSPGIFVNFFKK